MSTEQEVSYVFEDGIVRSTILRKSEVILLVDLFEREWSENTENVALIDVQTEETINYGELLQITRRLAATLQNKYKIQANDVVVFTAKTSIKSCCMLLALTFCQASIMSPKHSCTAYEYRELTKNMEIKLAIGDSISVPKLHELKSNHSQLTEVLNVDEVSLDGDASTNEPIFTKPRPSDPKNTIAFMTFTSGSTGLSKAVCISHYNIIAGILQYRGTYYKPLLSNPLSHLSGLLALIGGVIKIRQLCIVPDDVRHDIDKFVNICERYNIEAITALPVLLNKLIDAAPTISKRLTCLKKVFTGGSLVSQVLVNKFHTYYPDIILEQMYGLSESAGVILQATDMSNFHALEVAPNVEAKIVDVETRRTLGLNETGELIIRAPSIVLGYFNRPEATAEAFLADGWLATGDLVRLDEHARFFIVDRVKQMIKCLDSQVAPGDLEDIILRNEGVRQVLVAGTPHPKFGEAPTAFVVPKGDCSPDVLLSLRQQIIADVEEKCAYFKHLHGGLFFVRELPITESGKFSRKEILKKHETRSLSYLE